jgi:hypothetical protein
VTAIRAAIMIEASPSDHYSPGDECIEVDDNDSDGEECVEIDTAEFAKSQKSQVHLTQSRIKIWTKMITLDHKQIRLCWMMMTITKVKIILIGSTGMIMLNSAKRRLEELEEIEGQRSRKYIKTSIQTFSSNFQRYNS